MCLERVTSMVSSSDRHVDGGIKAWQTAGLPVAPWTRTMTVLNGIDVDELRSFRESVTNHRSEASRWGGRPLGGRDPVPDRLRSDGHLYRRGWGAQPDADPPRGSRCL
jgi:hypothetical protein